MPGRNGRIVLHDLADLAQVADLILPAEPPPIALPAGASDEPNDPPSEPVSYLREPVAPAVDDDVTVLTTALDAALAELHAVREADSRQRQEAGVLRDAYHDLQDTAQRLQAIVTNAEAAAMQAGTLATDALTDTDRDRAARIVVVAQSVATTAQAQLAAVADQAAGLAEQPALQRLLEDERQAAEVVQRDEDARRHAEELREGLARVETLLAEGKENEARRLLGALAKDDPDSTEPASYVQRLDRRVQAVKRARAEQALRQARRLTRRTPQDAVAVLVPLDLTDLPDSLVREVYGCWLAACRRLAPQGVWHYSPRFGQGAVLTRTDDGRVEVIAAIGLPEWTPGRRFAPTALRGARPL